MAKTLRKPLTKYRPQIRSRHPSHEILREELPLFPFRSVVRLGSIWAGDGKERVELNSVEAIKNSSDKLLMKQCFTSNNIVTAKWGKANEVDIVSSGAIQFISDASGSEGLDFPIVIKHRNGSRGTGNYLLSTSQEFEQWRIGKTLTNYIVESFHTFTKEYRLHVTADGCFYTCRKMLKHDAPVENKWQRHDDNCVWIVEENPSFDKPVNWVTIEAECVRALNAVGLDMGACDVKVQSATTSSGKVRKDPKFIVIEINSAPSMAPITTQKYLEIIPQLLTKKHGSSNG